jgi:hypothetical protein
MLCRVALIRTEVSEECIAFIVRVTRISELGTTLAVTSDRSTLLRNAMYNTTKLYYTTLHYILCCAVLCCAVLCCAVLRYTELYYTILY